MTLMNKAPEINVVPDAENPGAWRVEEIDADEDGGVAVAVFSGVDAEQRAREHAYALAHR